MEKTIECPVHAKIVPFSSVVGQSVMLTDETGAVVAQLSISIPSPSYPYRETAEEIACIVETAINQPPSEQVKRLRVRLGELMADEARRIAASEGATPPATPVQPTASVEAARYADFLDEAARYFENRPVNGEDAAHWSNVTNAETCREIAVLLRASLTPAPTQGDGT